MEQQINKNLLSAVRFRFSIQKTPNINFFVKSVNIPGLTLPSVPRPTPFKTLPYTGDHLQYDQLSVVYNVNEDLSNYIDMFNWITAVSFPESFNQYKKIASDESFTGGGIYSDGYITILSSSYQPILRISFTDLVPVSLSSIELTTEDTFETPIQATATFEFSSYKIERI